MFYSHVVMNIKVLKCFLGAVRYRRYIGRNSLYEILQSAVNKSLRSKNGRLDLFLRFLLGISLESNQRLLRDLLTHTENSSESVSKAIKFIQDRIRCDDLTADRCINLFLCLLEMNDQTLFGEIQDKNSKYVLRPSHCSAIVYMLQVSEEGRRRLIPAVVNCRKALLADCNLTDQFYESLASALHSSNSLRELDLSNNDLQDSGVKLLSDGLKSHNCQLQILRLSGCMVTKEGCCYLATALSSNPSHLRELDLSYNHPGPSGVQLLSDRLNDPNCTLNKLKIICKGTRGVCRQK
ncbi:putative NACHT [Triplophysa rosa]|uniref:NACHT n=1 Tax=Triplophysa rosa TaxID=992332 RepID=A0A9W7TW55_TRIRA|nr:putative NACHT [Triplophysa rosa]